VPPLRERKADIPELAHHFLFRFACETDRDVRGFTPEALDRFQRHDWPGNVRELLNCVRAGVLQATGPLILREQLLGVGDAQTPSPTALQSLDLPAIIESMLQRGEKQIHEQVVALVERELIVRALRVTQGNQTQASELLGLSRVTLRNKMRDLGIHVDKVVSGQDGEE
jgi:two-component system nitrogen regulation response regulator GlnG